MLDYYYLFKKVVIANLFDCIWIVVQNGEVDSVWLYEDIGDDSHPQRKHLVISVYTFNKRDYYSTRKMVYTPIVVVQIEEVDDVV